MKRRGGYLMGGWGDWVAFVCTDCRKLVYWGPDNPQLELPL